jgi:hypothetical protein
MEYINNINTMGRNMLLSSSKRFDNIYAKEGKTPSLGVSPYQSMIPNIKKLRMVTGPTRAFPNSVDNCSSMLVYNANYQILSDKTGNYSQGCYNNYANISKSYMEPTPAEIFTNYDCDLFKPSQ